MSTGSSSWTSGAQVPTSITPRRPGSPRSLSWSKGLAKVWFPAALLALLVLAIPGQILLLFHLLGQETAVNQRLQRWLQLTYHIGIPWWASLIALLIPFGIVLLYFLKLKRKPLQVPSTFLWRKSIEDLHVNSLFQWLRENVLLLLQVLIALALIYGVMNFQFHGRSAHGKRYIIMVDNSASMSASDVAPSRLDQAKKDALEMIDAYSDSDVGMVIVFNSSAQILQSYTTDRGLLRRAVESITPTQRPTRIEEALSLADSLANPQRSTEDESRRPPDVEPGKERTLVPVEDIPTEVHLYSDGRFPDVPEFALGNLNVHYHPIGSENVENVGVATLNAVRVEGDAGKLQVFVRVLNFRPQRTLSKVQLDVYTNGTFTGGYKKELELVPRTSSRDGGKVEPVSADVPGEGSATFEVHDVDSGANVVLYAKLANFNVSGEGADLKAGRPFQDPFPVDDEAWLVVGIVRKARVLIVGSPNKILHDFFDQPAAEKIATVTYLTPDKLEDDKAYRQPAREGAYDLVLFDRCSPGTELDMPLANAFFIDAVPPPWKKAGMPALENPRIKGWMSKHALMRNLVGLQDLGISDAFHFELDPRKNPSVPPRTPRLLETDGGAAVLFALNRRSFTDVVMTFPLMRDDGRWATDWPKEISFLLFLYNLLYNLGNVSDAAGEENLQPGQVKTLRPDVGVSQIAVEDPRHKTETLKRGTRADFTYGNTDSVGVYQVKWDGQVQRSFAVNLLDPEESNLEPRTQIQIGAKEIVAGETRSQPRETWKWIAVVALVLLLVEWFIYNRRIYI